MNLINNQEILITGCGSLCKAIVKVLCEEYNPKGIRIFSHSEYGQIMAKKEFENYKIPIAFLYGDIRDIERLILATIGVNIVIHTAAMKHVSKCENDCLDAIKTNIGGTKNVIMACIKNKINSAIFISSDKSCYPVNLYGATKAVGEKIWLKSNIYTPHSTKFFVCRYGNVLGSRGSVIPLFREQAKTGIVTITDKKMTRFWITLPNVAKFILNRIEENAVDTIFIPKMKSMKIIDLASVIAPDCKIKNIGIGEGEKLHECLITIEESRQMIEKDDMYIISPKINTNNGKEWAYYSDTNDKWLSKDELKKLIEVNGL